LKAFSDDVVDAINMGIMLASAPFLSGLMVEVFNLFIKRKGKLH
jgi:hypothetical protein